MSTWWWQLDSSIPHYIVFISVLKDPVCVLGGDHVSPVSPITLFSFLCFQIEYEYLVVAAGIQLNYDKVADASRVNDCLSLPLPVSPSFFPKMTPSA